MKTIPILAFACLLWNCQSRQSPPAVYTLDKGKSVITWKGYLKNGDSNTGTVAVRGDKITLEDGEIQICSFRVPLSTLVNLNLPTADLKYQLIQHLQSADFFNMLVYPEVRFDLTEIEKYTDRTWEHTPQANYRIAGGLTMLGKTHPVTFPARITITDEQITVDGKLTIDRTKWGMTYASDKAAPDGMYVKPGIDLHVRVRGERIL
ncbi:YceI family protein [Dyadobacter helix]|uniref:YceI family protein n=1 Tax=Dyadobacter helix TaxID=2822344 RepID=UPI001BFC9B4E|nr:YceI family protein [Dyadobacter sp. CECT 9275]